MTRGIGTPYDDSFRTLLNECPRLIIPVVNEMFGESFSDEEEVHLGANEIMLASGVDILKKITDSNFTIGDKKGYHIESQSMDDGSIAYRMVQYDTGIAIENADYGRGYVNLTYPDSGIIYLRDSINTPDEIKVNIKVPNGNVDFTIPTLKVSRYSLDEIFEKRLFFLIPFHLFVYEKKFKDYNEDDDKLAGDCSRIQEGVKRPMFGQVIETDFLKRVHEAEAKGRADALTEVITKTVRLMRRIGASEKEIINGLVDEFALTREEAEKYVK